MTIFGGMRSSLVLLLIILAIALPRFSEAQRISQDSLFAQIKSCDSLLFDVGFNQCDIKAIERVVAEDFSFYHDQQGITSTKQDFISGIENGLCKLDYRAERVLEPRSVNVYPLYRGDKLYGAVQTGKHHFYAIEGENHRYLTATALFTHTWILQNREWQLHMGLSYDHRDFEEPIGASGLFVDTEVTNNWLREKNLAALGIGYIEDGQIVQTSVFGEAKPGEFAQLNTIWNVASLTKPITAMVVLKLVDAGLIDLDEKLSAYFIDPDLRGDDRVHLLTARVVLSHQTGFPNWRGDEKDGRLKFLFDPGTKYQYSGEGYDYLRKALEAKFGRSLEVLATEWLFGAASMDHTHFIWKEALNTCSVALGYTPTRTPYVWEKHAEISAADNLLTTIGDYSRFVKYVLEGADLHPWVIAAMQGDQVRVSSRKHFGLGWWIDERIDDKDLFAMVHGGDDVGVHCIVFLIPNSKKGLVIFTNSDQGTEVYMDVIKHYLGEEAEGIFRAEME